MPGGANDMHAAGPTPSAGTARPPLQDRRDDSGLATLDWREPRRPVTVVPRARPGRGLATGRPPCAFGTIREAGLGAGRAAGALSQVVSLQRGPDDTLWAVVAQVGRTSRVAEIFPSRLAALADRNWREQQVRAYADFLRRSQQPLPHYSVAPIRRTDLPRTWRPLPALGFLRGQFI